MRYEARREGFLISTDPGWIDLDVVHGFLSAAYWCKGIPREVIQRGIENSMVFGVYEEHGAGGTTAPTYRTTKQVGFARVITDKATFAYLADVFILDGCRGRGLSKWLVEVILAHPQLQGLRRLCLLTRDAHGLYAKYGFKPMPDPSRYMELWDPGVYGRATS